MNNDPYMKAVALAAAFMTVMGNRMERGMDDGHTL